MQAVILCGGKGTRLTAASEGLPKPLVPVGGKPFVAYAIDILLIAGCTDVVLLVDRGNYSKVITPMVRSISTNADVNKAILGIPRLQRQFVLLNGDCYPVMKARQWRSFLQPEPKLAVDVSRKDQGLALVKQEDLEHRAFDASSFASIHGLYPLFIVASVFHINDPAALQFARDHMPSLATMTQKALQFIGQD